MQISVPSMQDLLSAGVHFGHQVRRGHPKMQQYIFGARDGVHIIDLAASEEKLKIASQAAYEIGKRGAVMLIVGVKKQARDIIKSLAKEADAPFLTERWIGGLLTNFDEIKKNIQKLSKLQEEQEKGQLTHYTKKEQLLISRKLSKFEAVFGGVAKLEKVPDAMFIVDGVSELTAIREANKTGISLIGICDTNADPNWYDYPIPGNDDGIKSIKMISETIIKSYAQGKKESGVQIHESSQEIKEAEKPTVKTKKQKMDESASKSKSTKEPPSDESKEVDQETAALEEKIEKEIVEESEKEV
ncbi:30S ribosomal protein S2 [Candidatus Daviesbacteria bacterium]|nr:30S ribosomal protein S2 [Candidatus Daviesbacteria bacterium]